MTDHASDYDPFAWFYNKHWSREISAQFLSVVESLLLPQLSPHAHILDLCCGTGQIAAALVQRGFRVTGIDASAEMLRYARSNAPGAEFIHANARSFELPPVHDAVISTFDSLNHLMSVADLTAALRRVHAALAGDGLFLFDMNLERGFARHWQDYFAIVKDEEVCVLRGDYDPHERVGRYDITVFRLEETGWRRSDAHVTERAYRRREIKDALRRAGFTEFAVYDAEKDAGMEGHTGRLFFLARKTSPSEPVKDPDGEASNLTA